MTLHGKQSFSRFRCGKIKYDKHQHHLVAEETALSTETDSSAFVCLFIQLRHFIQVNHVRESPHRALHSCLAVATSTGNQFFNLPVHSQPSNVTFDLNSVFLALVRFVTISFFLAILILDEFS